MFLWLGVDSAARLMLKVFCYMKKILLLLLTCVTASAEIIPAEDIKKDLNYDVSTMMPSFDLTPANIATYLSKMPDSYCEWYHTPTVKTSLAEHYYSKALYRLYTKGGKFRCEVFRSKESENPYLILCYDGKKFSSYKADFETLWVGSKSTDGLIAGNLMGVFETLPSLILHDLYRDQKNVQIEFLAPNLVKVPKGFVYRGYVELSKDSISIDKITMPKQIEGHFFAQQSEKKHFMSYISTLVKFEEYSSTNVPDDSYFSIPMSEVSRVTDYDKGGETSNR